LTKSDEQRKKRGKDLLAALIWNWVRFSEHGSISSIELYSCHGGRVFRLWNSLGDRLLAFSGH
jgi:hypothetical protein